MSAVTSKTYTATIGARPPEFSAIRSNFMQWVHAGRDYVSWGFGLFGGLPMDILIVLMTLGIFALVTFVYLKLKPTVFLPNSEFAGQCPDRWIYREEVHAGSDMTAVQGKCYPTYQTTGAPFDPALYTHNRCEIAKSCGTTWVGVCN